MLNVITKKGSIKQKLISINLLTVCIAMLLAGSAIFLNIYISFRNIVIDNLITQAKILSNNCVAPITFEDKTTALEDLKALASSQNIIRAIIFTRDGKVFADYRRAGSKGDIPPSTSKSSYLFKDNQLHVVQAIELDRERIGTIYLSSDLTQLYALMARYGVISIIIMIVVFLISFLLLTSLQKLITKPMSELAGTMHVVSHNQDYTLRVSVSGEDEIGTLATGFNKMLEQIRQRDVTLQVEIAERKRAEESVRRLNDELEVKVRERTKQLLETQEELVRKEKLATLGQLSGSIGHELRNPLGVMHNAVYFLKMINPHADETTWEYLEIINHEIQRSQRIINDLLDFARTKTPQKQIVPVGDLVRESLLRCDVSEKVTLRCDIPDCLPPLNIDPLQMGQVFQNLITNSVEAMPDGGLLEISGRIVPGPRSESDGSEATGRDGRADSGPCRNLIEICVADNGIGISPENLKKLFQPLFTTKARGIGLGLTVCRNLTEANGGRISVKSELGKGTKFEISFPLEG